MQYSYWQNLRYYTVLNIKFRHYAMRPTDRISGIMATVQHIKLNAIPVIRRNMCDIYRKHPGVSRGKQTKND